MKKCILSMICMLIASWSFAELPKPIPMNFKESMLQADINVRSIPEQKPATIQSQQVEEYPEPIPMNFKESMFPTFSYSYQPSPSWYQQQYAVAQAWQRWAAWQQQQQYWHNAAMVAAYAPMPEPVPTPQPTPRPTATPQPTPTPVVQRVIQERVIVEKVITIIVTPTPLPENAAKQEQARQHLAQLAAQTDRARNDLLRWMIGAIAFGLISGGMLAYVLMNPHKEG